MANIINHNFQNLKLRVNCDEYWDFFVNTDAYDGAIDLNKSALHDECLIAYIDVDLYDCVMDNWINSLPKYQWEKAHSTDSKLHNIGYTGYDNGLLQVRKDRITNKDIVKLYEESTFDIKEGICGAENVLKLHTVSGSTQVWEYPIEIRDYNVKLNGGFFQGFFKTTCSDYQVLPSTLESGDVWGLEFMLKKEEHEKVSMKTLNDKYPQNKGLFFYIGTRAENKWPYLYDDVYNDESKLMDSDDYIEDTKIDVKSYKIDAFLDMEPTINEYEETALDVYTNNVSHIETDISEDDTIFDVDWPERDNIIVDEEIMDWCCNYSTQAEVKKKIWCGCGNQGEKIDIETITKKGYFTKCEIFGDDYLEDINTINDIEEYIEDDLDIIDWVYETSDGLTIGINQEYIDTDNKFLLFDRTCNGLNAFNYKEGTTFRYIKQKNTFNENLFLLMNRTCTGYNVNTIQELKSTYNESYDVLKDLYNNALAFRITDDGAIGYRYLVQDCETEEGYEILEGYSKPNLIKDNEWVNIHVKIEGHPTTMIIKFYVNGNLVFISKELPKLDLRALQEVDSKQESVPYNISIGGGTQGLADVLLPNYMIEPYRTYPLEKHFGGSFIGWFKSFKFYNCSVEHLKLQENFRHEVNKLKQSNIY